jgi:NADH-quinone oxidoreductase subunit F
MPSASRVLPLAPVPSLAAYLDAGGGRALVASRRVDPATLIDVVDAAGLRGRGGAGFPTGRKWRTVAANCTPTRAATVVVNGAEGEPGCFKDRTIMRVDPYRILEGALVAARAVGADTVVFALKRIFEPELERIRSAVAEAENAGWFDGLAVDVFAGPSEYLYGEETGLLEAIDGRYPFPRVAPPYRRGVDEVLATAGEVEANSSSAAQVLLAGPDNEAQGPPTLVDNAETLANVAGIIADGADWFRSIGTDASPGTIVCTVSGAAPRHGVAEFAMGTPLREVLETVGRVDTANVLAVMVGVSSPLLRPEDLDLPLAYEAFAEAGTGLGTAGFIVLDATVDLAAVAAGVARFLAVESCGQCTPCKQDGRVIADELATLVGTRPHEIDLTTVRKRLDTVADGARCNLASQQQAVVGSVLARFPDAVGAHLEHTTEPATVVSIAPIVDIVDGVAVLDEHQARKQPDWTFDAFDSGRSPADRLDDHRAPHESL